MERLTNKNRFMGSLLLSGLGLDECLALPTTPSFAVLDFPDPENPQPAPVGERRTPGIAEAGKFGTMNA
jgi:hypothetical protein